MKAREGDKGQSRHYGPATRGKKGEGGGQAGADADLLPDEGLLNRGQVLERAEDEVCVLPSSDKLSERSELLCESEEDLVLVVELVLEERDQLLSRALRAESERDRRQPPDRRQTKGDVVRLELI